ncbi:uncharacterized protein [Elaeis guineensis]|uniref:uncharacterized protein isoform X2 n=1 Tax=Elaeis guineensis var. tenera TaxID=51953 RepID=UPI003C6D077B
MAGLSLKLPFWMMYLITQLLVGSVISGYSWCPIPPSKQTQAKFKQKTNRFWKFAEQTNTWVEISLPFDLMSCINETCTKVGSIESIRMKRDRLPTKEQPKYISAGIDRVLEENIDPVLPLRKRVSLTRMSEASVWVTGQSGSIYERFWNGVKWVIAPHELPTAAGQAVSVFIVNQTILALAEGGMLYQLQLNENSQPIWTEFVLMSEQGMHTTETEPSPVIRIKFGIVSHDGVRLYFSTMNGSLIEISEFQPLRLDFHGRPPGGDISAIVDTGTIRPGIVFTVRRKWKWALHGAPKDHRLSAIMPVQQSDINENILSLFFTANTGYVFEYQLPKNSGGTYGNHAEGLWINHMHPQHAKVARGVQGIQVQFGRLMFPLDDGRLGELHLPGIGGDGSGPTHQSSLRRKTSNKYEWSVIDVPETEGWNAEYCTDDRGPSNCITGIKNVLSDDEPNDSSIITPARRRKAQGHQEYISLSNHESGATESYNFLTRSINTNFRMRVMYADRSFFVITDSGLTFEYLYSDNVWLWLRHEHSTAMRGALGSYNGSLFLVNTQGNLLIRERSGNELSWINCTAMRKGKQVATGPPWDVIPGKSHRATTVDALFFVDKKGKLLQFMVALRKFKWKDCHSPPDTRIAFIVDQEFFRMNIIFVVGRNGRLYQYNRITELWHEHYQSPHLVLSRSPGTAMRPSLQSLTGSLFMISENGGLVEYHWNLQDGWEWVEHGTPYRDVTLVGAPGPCFDGTQLFVIGSDGHVYRRFLEQRTWKWMSHGYPNTETSALEAQRTRSDHTCTYEDKTAYFEYNNQYSNNYNRHCNEKVAPIRPIPFSQDSVIFELQDGRLAELRRSKGTDDWVWARVIVTPTSLCLSSYWTAVAT